MSSPEHPWVLQICHGYDGPFLDCARQYAALFQGTQYKVLTVYLTGDRDTNVEAGSASDEVIFLEYTSRQMRGLKLSALRDIARLGGSRSFALCIAHRFKPTYLACLATRLPIIAVSHAFGVYRRRVRQWFANAFRKRLMLFGVSDAVRNDLRRCLPTWQDGRILCLYNRVDLNQAESCVVDGEQARRALGLSDDCWIVGNVGRLHPDKDQATLLKGFATALPSLPANSVLAIIGEGRLERSLKLLAAKLGIAEHVHFLGSIADARRFFRAFDAFALTSDHEPFGMVLLEAMVAGVPIVCSDCGGGREVVADVGLLFPLGRADILADRLIAIAMQTDEQREGFRSAARERLIERFSDAQIKRRFWALPDMSSFVTSPRGPLS